MREKNARLITIRKTNIKIITNKNKEDFRFNKTDLTIDFKLAFFAGLLFLIGYFSPLISFVSIHTGYLDDIEATGLYVTGWQSILNVKTNCLCITQNVMSADSFR